MARARERPYRSTAVAARLHLYVPGYAVVVGRLLALFALICTVAP
jgi:hypothetical protein